MRRCRRLLGASTHRPPPVPTWPGFRGPLASGVADGQDLPAAWNGVTGENIRWKVAIPGLAHSSPIVWGDRLFVTTAISSRADATFKPGLYGEGTASEDRTPQRWVVMAIDRARARRSGSGPPTKGAAREAAHQGDLRERHARRPTAATSSRSSGRRGSMRSTWTAG